MTLRSLLSILLASCVSASAFAQASIDRATLSASGPLSDAQKSAVTAFISKNGASFKPGTDAKAMDDARWAMVSTLRDPAASPMFRKAFAVAAVSELGPLVKGTDVQGAVQAMQVLRFTRATEAIDMLVERSTPSSEPSASKRVSASTLLVEGLKDVDANAAYFESASRRLREAAVAETDPIALQQKFFAIASAARRKDLPPDNARVVRRALVESMSGVAKSIRTAKSADARMQAMQRALISVRNDILEMSQAERSDVAKILAPALSDLIAAAGAQWDSAHDGALAASYAATMNSCEVLLRLLDRGMRPSAYEGAKPDSEQRVLQPAWDDKDRAKFDAEAKKWAGIVGAAPYR